MYYFFAVYSLFSIISENEGRIRLTSCSFATRVDEITGRHFVIDFEDRRHFFPRVNNETGIIDFNKYAIFLNMN
jgi:hypothetical protein